MQIGNYEIVEQIGAGAMGVVYKAQHTRVRRGHLFAIKLMNSVIADRPDLVARFHREIEVVGRLEHPNIVNVVDAGDHQGSPYLVMEYLQGESLEKYIADRRPVPFAKKLEIVAAVCHGLDYAHKQGVVHRDVKPANIILLSDLTPKIVDFGVAHIADNTVTKTGMIVGTISYMSPEQLNGSHVDGRTDVFSASIVLYEFLSTRLPFEGADTAAIMKKILLDAPPPLRNFVQPCPFQVEAILAKGLAKDAAYRYSALEMATELDKLQETELVMEAAADAAMQGTVLTPAARVQPKPADVPPPHPAARPAMDSQASTINLSQPAVPVPVQDTTEVLPSQAAAASANTVPAPEQQATRISRRPISPPPAATVKPAEQQVSAEAAQPAPVVPEEIPLSAPAESELPAPKGHLKKLLLAFAVFCGVVLAVIGVLSITGSPANMTPVAAGSAWGAVYSVAFSPDGRYIASGGGDNLAKIWDTTISRYVDMPGRHSDSVRSVAFSHDGKYLASASDDKTVKIWEVAGGRELYTLTGHTDSVYSVAFSPDGNLLASAGSDKTIKFWSLKDGRQVTSLDAGAAVYSLAFNPDGMSLAYGCADQTIKIQKIDWGVYISSFSKPHVLEGHHSVVSSVAFSPDGKTLASGSYDDTVKFWDVASGHELNTWNGWRYTVDAVAFSPDGRFVAAGGIEREVRLWDVAAGREIRKLDNAASYLSAIWMDMNHVGPSIEAVAFSPDGRYLAAGATNSRGVELWDLSK